MRALDAAILSDHEIRAAQRSGEIAVSPFDPGMVRPAALSVRLGAGACVLVPSGDDDIDVADASTHPLLEPRCPDELGRLRLDPGEVMLAPTFERVALSIGLAGLIDGTSDYARLGISVVLCHQVSPGFGSDVEGGAVLTLEIVSRLPRPVHLRVGTRIGNLLFLRCGPVERSYADMPANYSRDQLVRPSRLAEHHVSVD
jgi:dCTP deaminase